MYEFTTQCLQRPLMLVCIIQQIFVLHNTVDSIKHLLTHPPIPTPFSSSFLATKAVFVFLIHMKKWAFVTTTHFQCYKSTKKLMKMIFFHYKCKDDWAFAPLVLLWQWRPEAYEVPEQADCIQVLPASHRVQIHQACHGERLQHPATAASQRQELGGQAGCQCSTSAHWPAVVRLFASISQLKPWGSPNVGEMVVCAAVSPQLYILSYMQVQCLLPLWLMHSDFGGFSNGVYHVVKIRWKYSWPGKLNTTDMVLWP